MWCLSQVHWQYLGFWRIIGSIYLVENHDYLCCYWEQTVQNRVWYLRSVVSAPVYVNCAVALSRLWGQYRVSTRRRHCDSNVVVLVIHIINAYSDTCDFSPNRVQTGPRRVCEPQVWVHSQGFGGLYHVCGLCSVRNFFLLPPLHRLGNLGPMQGRASDVMSQNESGEK